MVLDWSNLIFLPAAPAKLPANEKLAPIAAPRPAAGPAVESCGRAYHVLQFPEAAVKAEADGDDGAAGNAEEEELKDELRAKLDDPKLDLEDYYALMGLKELGWKSTTKQIKDNWKIVSFVCHPDKSAPDNRAYGEKRFKQMQLAFSTLTDKVKRIGYDSALPFDEAIPSSKQGNGDAFYKVYGPVFDRNARFSERKPVPELGDKDTPMTEVDKFYDFWLGFKSWRDFAYLNEHKNDDGTDRYQRRENDRKNAKLRAGKKKEETGRVRKLVEEAMGKDPRVVAARAAEAAAIKAKKDEKKNKALREKEEAERVVREAREAEEAAKKAIEDAKNDAKKNAKKFKDMKKKLPKLAKSGRAGFYEEDEVTLVAAGATFAQLEKIVEAMSLHSGPSPPPLSAAEIQSAQDVFAAALRSLRSDDENAAADAKAAEKKAAEGGSAADDSVSRDWIEAEEAVLREAVVKYAREWPRMTDLVNDVSLVKRTKQEVIHKAKEIEALMAQEELAKARPATAPAATSAAAVADDWTAEQQAALEAGLKKFPASTNKRFESIAPLVKGKTKKECVERFKAIRAKVQGGGNTAKDWYFDDQMNAIPCYPGAPAVEKSKEASNIEAYGPL